MSGSVSATTEKEQLIPAVRNSNLESISAMLSLNCYAVIMMCLFSVTVMGVTLFLPGAINDEQRIYVGLTALVTTSVVSVLICARRNPSALALWTWIAATVAGFLMGASFMILVPHK